MGTPYIAFQVLENLESKCELGEAPGKVFFPIVFSPLLLGPCPRSIFSFLSKLWNNLNVSLFLRYLVLPEGLSETFSNSFLLPLLNFKIPV